MGNNNTVNLTQTCSAVGAECTIKNLMSNQIDNLVTNLIKDTESNEGVFSLLGPSSTESENVSTENQSNNVNAVILGNNNTFNAAQTGDMDKATCALDTIVKNVITNTANNTAINTESSCSMLKFLIIIGVILVLVLVVPILFNLAKRIGRGKSSSEEKSSEEKSSEEKQSRFERFKFWKSKSVPVPVQKLTDSEGNPIPEKNPFK